MIKKILFVGLLASLSIVGKVNAQGMAVGATTPDASAMFEVRSIAKGLLIPRLTTTQRNAITSPATGLQLYNTTTNTLEYYNGTAWVSVNQNFWTADTYGITYTSPAGGIGIGGASESNNTLTVTQKTTGGFSGAAVFKSSDTWHTVLRIDNSTSAQSYQFNLAGSSNTAIPSRCLTLYNATTNRFAWIVDGVNSYLGVGSYNSTATAPKSRLHVFAGDVNIDQIGSGIILKSPNGNCWRVTIDDAGNLVRTAISCP